MASKPTLLGPISVGFILFALLFVFILRPVDSIHAAHIEVEPTDNRWTRELKADGFGLQVCTFISANSALNPCLYNEGLELGDNDFDPINVIFYGFSSIDEVAKVLGSHGWQRLNLTCRLLQGGSRLFAFTSVSGPIGSGGFDDIRTQWFKPTPTLCLSEFHIRLFQIPGTDWILGAAHHEEGGNSQSIFHNPDMDWEGAEREVKDAFSPSQYDTWSLDLGNTREDGTWRRWQGRGLVNDGKATLISKKGGVCIGFGCLLLTPQATSSTVPANGSLVTRINPSIAAPIYLIEGNRKRWIPSLDVFNSCGFQMNSVIQLDQTQLDSIPNGQDLLNCAPPTPSIRPPGYTPEPSCSAAPGWAVGQRVRLHANPQIRAAPSFSSPPYQLPPIPDGWEVDIIGGPTCAEGAEWWNTSRQRLDGGGTGWVDRGQAQGGAPSTTPGPRPTPSNTPYGSCDGVTSGAYMYSDQQGHGDCVRISQAVPNLDSIRIEGKNVNDWINSIHLVGINFVRVCENSGGGGRCLSVTSDKDSLAPDSMEHKISSVYFTSNTPTGPTDANCTSSQLRVEFYTDKNFSNIGTVKCRDYGGTGEFVEGGSYAWGSDSGPPELGGQGGNFSIRWRGTFNYAAGHYKCFTFTDDGSMLYFDGNVVVDNHGDHSRERHDGERDLAAGLHELKVDYQQGGGEGAVSGDCQRTGDIAGTPIPPATFTPTPTATPIPGASPTPTATLTPTPQPSTTSTPTPVPIPGATATFTPAVPPTATWTPFVPPTATWTPVPVPPTATWTPLAPTATYTVVPPTATWTPISTLTPTSTPTRTPTPTPTFTPIPLQGNIARVATISGGSGCGAVLTDGSLAQTCHAGSSIQFAWSRPAGVQRVLLFNNGGVNWFDMYMSDGTHFHVDFGGPNTCVQVNFATRNITSLRIDFTDGIPSTMKEIEIWAGAGSGFACSTLRSY